MAQRRGLGDKRLRHDAAYRRAKREKHASRAIYKLEEIDKRFRLFKPGSAVLDLGCWPGGWLEYIARRVGPEGRVVGVDVAEVEINLPEYVECFVGDVYKLRPGPFAARFGPFDAVVSDLAPKTTGDTEGDVHRSEELFLHALAIARETSRPGGHFAAKVFQGGRFSELLGAVRGTYQEFKAFRPKTTRKGSREQYIVGRGLRRASSPVPTDPADLKR
jgi:23S rRNA (uridine2552-2'-O)-methyltransferase